MHILHVAATNPVLKEDFEFVRGRTEKTANHSIHVASRLERVQAEHNNVEIPDRTISSSAIVSNFSTLTQPRAFCF